MEFLNISDIKLKVTLSAEECREYGIDTEKTNFDGAYIRRVIRQILASAEQECGFSTGADKILVQLYPLPDRSCELLVTRLLNISRRDRAVLSSSDGLSLIEDKRATYRFESWEYLCRAVRAAYRAGAVSDLYRDDLGRYYISLTESLTDGISEFEVFVEFGERLSALPIGVLSEYGTRLARGNALDLIYQGRLEVK